MIPEFIPPMLAKTVEPFDSDEFIFEVKWDGTRALAFADGEHYWWTNRRQNDLTEKYPELDFASRLPAGTILDGEIVIFEGDQPVFSGMLRREQARTPQRAEALAREIPGTFLAFDLLYFAGDSWLDRPVEERREGLAELIAELDEPRCVFSDGVIGGGRAYFEQVAARGIEGVVAKQLGSRYRPGKRLDTWVKMKRKHERPCLILGYRVDEGGEVRSLLIAAERDGQLTYAGRVGSGLSSTERSELTALLAACPAAQSFLPTPDAADHWVEPRYFCHVRYLEWPESGHFRAPVYRGLVE